MASHLVSEDSGESASSLHVLVVDDSAHSRRTLKSLLEELPEVGSVEVAGNGRLALKAASKRPPDVVLLDLGMPVMNGFTFLRLFRTRSEASVLVVSSRSSLSTRQKTVELGASGFIPKPGDPYADLELIGEELRLRIREIARRRAARNVSPTGPLHSVCELDGDFPVVAIGSSSGGPQTLQYLLSQLPRIPAAAVLIAQHMPEGFTVGFARRLSTLFSMPIREGRNGDRVVPGAIFLAPGGSHMSVKSGGGSDASATLVIEDADDDVSSPSVDRLFRSVAEVYGRRVTAVVLTGMGNDGAEGVREVKAQGGFCIAESQETAAIFGMPREAMATGCVDELLPITEIAVRLVALCGFDQETTPPFVAPAPTRHGPRSEPSPL